MSRRFSVGLVSEQCAWRVILTPISVFGIPMAEFPCRFMTL
jgi:hypothetical protein